MQLQLSFHPPALPVKINYTDRLFMVGSCFAEHVGEKFQQAKMNVLINPHGILFNPHSICQSIKQCMEKKVYQPEELILHGELWHSFRHHGSFSHPDQQQVLANINQSLSNAHEALKQARFLIITLGSAWAYEHKDTGVIVANCHKVHQKEFTKVLLKAEVLKNDYLHLIVALRNFNPGLKVIFTISPVRYVRDGLVENNLSKAQLFQLVHDLCGEQNCFYFPAYEWVIDVLRDHRFYEEDLVHPNSSAIDFVWEKFRESCFSEEAKRTHERVMGLVNAFAHRVLHQGTEQHRKFKQQLEEKLKMLQADFPYINWEQEKLLLGA